MQNKLNELLGKDFILLGVKYRVKEVKVVRQKAVIITDRKPFNMYQSEFDEFYGQIQICESAPGLTVYETKVLPDEIVESNNITMKISSKLMDVFDSLSEDVSEANLKKAKAMVEVSNAVVNVQMVNLKFLTLKNG